MIKYAYFIWSLQISTWLLTCKDSPKSLPTWKKNISIVSFIWYIKTRYMSLLLKTTTQTLPLRKLEKKGNSWGFSWIWWSNSYIFLVDETVCFHFWISFRCILSIPPRLHLPILWLRALLEIFRILGDIKWKPIFIVTIKRGEWCHN